MLRCLAKCPDERFGGYQELRAELTRFATRGKRPAEPWQRLAAGAVDFAIIGLPVLAACRMLPWVEFAGLPAFLLHIGMLFTLVCTVMVLWIAWFTLSEWKFGRTPGKALLGLEVRGKPPGYHSWPRLLRVLGRASLFVVLPVIFAFWAVPPLRITGAQTTPVTRTFFGHRLEGTSIRYRYASTIGLTTFAVWGGGIFLLFAAARRRNGWLALHDRLTDTCVVSNAVPQNRPSLMAVEQTNQMAAAATLGPFHSLAAMAGTGNWFVGFDPNLLRQVWLRKLPPGTPPVAAALRNLRRAGRLRWLAGVRSAEENWDAYECPGGRALLKLAAHRVSWCELRIWMADLAAELSAATMDDTRFDAPYLEQVWITADGRAKLLDFPAPGIGLPQTPAGGPFWAELVERMLGLRPLPLPVRGFLQTLPHLATPATMLRELEFLAAVPVAVSRSRRLAIIATGGAAPVLLGLALYWMESMSLAAAGFWALGSPS